MISRFEEVKHYPLQVFNRCVVACNLIEDGGGVAAIEDYVEGFSDKEKQDMQEMYKFVKKYGYKKTRELVTAGLEFSDEDYKSLDD